MTLSELMSDYFTFVKMIILHILQQIFFVSCTLLSLYYEAKFTWFYCFSVWYN